MSFKFPKILFWIGDPSKAKPHNDLSGLQKFVTENPDWAVAIVVDSDQEQAELSEKLKTLCFPQFHPGGLIIPWTDDTDLLDSLCADLHFVQVWKVVGSAWYECPCGEVLPSTLKEPKEKCDKCGQALQFVRKDEERVKRFNEVMLQAVNLMNFDTRSGNVLNVVTNPTGNVLRNMPGALGTKRDPALKLNSFLWAGKGKTAICAASGPSLKHAMEHLKRLQDKVLILTPARNFKGMIEAGVRPHFIFSCEMFPWDSVILQGVTEEMSKGTILCYPPVCAPETITNWPGEKLCTWDVNTAELIGEPLSMTGGNSVAHHMYNFAAEILQADKIILAGQDLGYTEPDGKTHVGFSFHEFPKEVNEEDRNPQAESWGPCTSDTAGPFHPECHRQSVFLERGAKPVGPVQVRTSPSYKNFGTLFEILIRRHKKPTWNACPNGLKILGAPYLDLSTFTGRKDSA